MGVVEQSSANVEACLSSLEVGFGSVSVNQTTFGVPPDRYEYVRDEMEGCADLYAKVYNDDDQVLHLLEDGDGELPRTTGAPDDSLIRTVRRQVRARTGVKCKIEAIEQATIVGIRDVEHDDRDTLYRLSVVFEGSQRAGSPNQHADWQDAVTTPDKIYA